MSYVPNSSLLHGVPYQVAECYGKPHYLCGYTGRGVNATKLFDGARCITCGRPATNAHHWPPKGSASTFALRGLVMKPALLAVCGSGTTGCHNGWHGGARFRGIWKWDSDEYARKWWESDWPEEIGLHSQELYRYGCWELYDMEQGRIWQVRL